jgi:LuxR family maltose regulon positive regulatory protein
MTGTPVVARSIQASIAGVDIDRPGQAALVDRPRLISMLEGSEGQVVLVQAPAGYGKSSLLSQWAAHDRRPFASISLSEAHNDPIVLLTDLVEALETIEPVPTDVAPVALAPKPDLEPIVPRLEYAIYRREIPMVLVLDELEHIESAGSMRLISAIAENIGNGSQIAVAARTTATAHFGRLRAGRRVTELAGSELSMTSGEARDLLARIGLHPSPEGLKTLHDRTEGWPAALYLAGLVLRNSSDLEAAIAHFAGDERIVVDYISEELLSRLPQPDVEFLVSVSILDTLEGDLCNAVVDSRDSAKRLQDLSRQNMLLRPLDRSDRRFRLHPLLTDMLRAELGRREAGLALELHRRASSWLAENGEVDLAVGHSLAAGDFGRVGELTWAAVPEYMARGRHGTIERWLERVGLDRIVKDPHLALTVAHGHLSRGEGAMAEHWGGVTQGLLEEIAADERDGSLISGLALVDSVLARRGTAEMARLSQRAAESLDGESPWLSMCSMMGGIAAHLDGKRDLAAEMLADGARRAAVWGAPIIQVLSLAQLALLAAEREDWQLADILASQSRSQVQRSSLGEYPTMALVLAVSAYSKAHRGRPEEAAAAMTDATHLLSGVEEIGSWYEAETHATLAVTATMLDDASGARAHLGEAVRQAERTLGAPVLDEWLAAIEARVATLPASTVGGLTPAELRVLRLLPTHLSFPQMAGELYVSPNTVKTQARAIYGKLGVSSRRDAVDRARRAGLLA